ncbi:MAG: hypothetical protein ACXWP4_05900, partial [Polyangiales bacterium]
GCGTTTIAPTLGTTCAGAVPIDMGSACVQTYEGDSCTDATISTSCGAGQAQIYAISIATGARLYAIKVSDGFSLAVIPGIAPFCGGAGSCVGSGMSTGVGAGSTQFWTVLKTGGGCGTYTLTITPS